MVTTAAKLTGVPPERLAATIAAESGFNPMAVSHDKNGKPVAYGLAQFIPETAAALGITDLADPMQSLLGAGLYLNQLYVQFKDWDLTHAAYNAGPGSILKRRVPNIQETKDYVARIHDILGAH